MIDPRYLVLERFQGRTIPSVIYGENKRVDRLIKQKRAAKIEISPLQALFGPHKLLRMAMERR